MKRTPEEEVLLQVARAVTGISTQAADQLGDISVVQLRALTVLAGLDTASLAELADGLGVTVSTTSRLVDRLVAAGYADRRTSAHSRRQLALRLTRSGKATVERYDRYRLERMHELLEQIEEGRRASVLAALEDFAAAARHVHQPSPPAESA